MQMANNPTSGTAPRPKWHRAILWAGGFATCAVIALASLAAWYLHRAEPILREALIAELQSRFHGRVDLPTLTTSLADGFQVEGRGLQIWLPAPAPGDDPSAVWFHQPWITVDKLTFHANWRMAPGQPIEIALIRISGVHVLLPPKADRPKFTTTQTAPPIPAVPSAASEARSALTGLLRPPKVIVRRIECADLDLVIARGPSAGKPSAAVPANAPTPVEKPPLDFQFRDLSLTPIGDGSLAFVVDMINPRPIGTVHATGQLGPWSNTEPAADSNTPRHFDPGALPVSGNFTFAKADLSSISGISGHLEALGQFQGILRRLAVTGDTETPDFRLARADVGPGVPLTTHFQASVDGTDGNTTLDQVDATLGQSHLIAHGLIQRAIDAGTGIHGHDIALEVTVDHGRIEDFLHVSIAEQPLMTGNLTLTTHFHLRPSPEAQQLPVLERLDLSGFAQADSVHFTSEKIQSDIRQISLRGQGQPGQLKSKDDANINTAITAHFTLSAGQVTVPDLAASVPGAEIDVHGTYALGAGTLNFDGDAKMQSSLSKMVGGWKGMLLKPADRFLRKNGAATDVPVHLTGTRAHPTFGVDWDRIGKTD
jgi:hypothetical protein